MLRRRLISLFGFCFGALIVFLNFPPTLLTPPLENNVEEVLEPVATKSPNAAPTPNTSPTNVPTVSPTDKQASTPTPKPSVTTTASKSPIAAVIKGDIFAAGKYGEVQIQITLLDSTVTEVKALVFPNGDSRSSSLSAMAIPQLISQTLKANGTSDIQGVSGASYTSQAWKESLASALSRTGF
jgi:uncharacterized protein with FMN-binding domain